MDALATTDRRRKLLILIGRSFFVKAVTGWKAGTTGRPWKGLPRGSRAEGNAALLENCL
jgi:hypothetical protein